MRNVSREGLTKRKGIDKKVSKRRRREETLDTWQLRWETIAPKKERERERETFTYVIGVHQTFGYGKM